jgi:tRNA dimethylallyltransferase
VTENNLIVITGPTAVGKTRLAALLAHAIGGEIISADSRQVYKQMDIGTGKDLAEYVVNDKAIPFHLINIREPGYKYNIKEFYPDFLEAYRNIISKAKPPILCGGSGLYIETAIRGNPYAMIPENPSFREKLADKTDQELYHSLLSAAEEVRVFADYSARKKIIRALEIDDYLKHKNLPERETEEIRPIIFALDLPRDQVKSRILVRLRWRLEHGLIEEVKGLLASGLTSEDLRYYGLEYKWVTDYIQGNVTYEEMFDRLNIGIRQFAKRQMTWFRRMEKQGYDIHWLDAAQEVQDQLRAVLKILTSA